MRLFFEVSERMEQSGKDEDTVVREVLREMKAQKKRVSGFGHRLHTQDPRTERLFSLAEELSLSGKHVKIARKVEKLLEETLGRSLPINVDGAIAALLCDLDFAPDVGNAFFIIARVAGLTAHVQEEKTRMRPMRKIHPQDIEYDGPEGRKV
jgi:citrate synthase